MAMANHQHHTRRMVSLSPRRLRMRVAVAQARKPGFCANGGEIGIAVESACRRPVKANHTFMAPVIARGLAWGFERSFRIFYRTAHQDVRRLSQGDVFRRLIYPRSKP